MAKSITIRFDDGVAEQVNGSIKRIVGFVRGRYVCDLLDNVTLEANPRAAKVNSVVNAIVDDLPNESGIFPFKTKGILIAASEYEPEKPRRYKLTFDESKHEGEGLLDGGHNMLALGIYFLKCVDEEIVEKIKFWEDMKDAWSAHREEVKAIRDQFDFKLPVELLVPADPEDIDGKISFRNTLFSICAARNNNVELSLWTKADKKGFYESIRKQIPKKINDRVEWKTNEWGDKTKKPIPPRDIIALVWLPLLVLQEAGFLPSEGKTALYNIYANKGKLSTDFDKLMEHRDVSNLRNGRYELKNSSVGSAFEILSVLPTLYDYIFRNMHDAYDKNGENFLKINAVKKGNFFSPYLQEPCDCVVPGGFIMPVLCGLRALMDINDDGEVFWKTDPGEFLEKHMVELVKTLKMPMDMAKFDPQKIGTNPGSYDLMFDKVDMLYKLSQH